MTRSAFLGLLLLGAVPGCATRTASAPRSSRTARRGEARRTAPSAPRQEAGSQQARNDPPAWRDRD